MQSADLHEVPGRTGNFAKGTRKVPALPKTFLKGRYLPYYITKRNDAVQISELPDGPEKVPTLPKTILEGKTLSIIYLK